LADLDAKKLEITNLSHNCFALSQGRVIVTPEAKIVFNPSRKISNQAAF
jgi:hypothetical protein